MVFEGLNHIGNSGFFLSDSNVDAVKFFLIVTQFEGSLLVDDGIDGNSGFSSLSVSDD